MGAKFGLMFGAIGLFALVFAAILLLASRVRGAPPSVSRPVRS